MNAYLIWNVTPEIFPGFEFLRWYGLCWVIGLLLGIRLLRNRIGREEVSIDIEKLTIYMIVGIMIGARLGHILFYEPQFYWENPEALLPFRLNPFEYTGIQGLASHGGVIGTAIALFLFCRKTGHRFLYVIDRLVIPGSILAVFIRIGNFMNSEILGAPSDAPWAVVFTHIDNTPRHPSQLYEAFFYLLIFFVLVRLQKSSRISSREGALFGAGLGLVFLMRFVIEFLKENQVAFESNMPLNMGQLLSIPMVLLGAYFLFRTPKLKV